MNWMTPPLGSPVVRALWIWSVAKASGWLRTVTGTVPTPEPLPIPGEFRSLSFCLFLLYTSLVRVRPPPHIQVLYSPRTGAPNSLVHHPPLGHPYSHNTLRDLTLSVKRFFFSLTAEFASSRHPPPPPSRIARLHHTFDKKGTSSASGTTRYLSFTRRARCVPPWSTSSLHTPSHQILWEAPYPHWVFRSCYLNMETSGPHGLSL